MKPCLLFIIVPLLLVVSLAPSHGQELDFRFIEPINALEANFGNISHRVDQKESCDLSFSAPFSQISEIFKSLDKPHIQIKKASIFGRNQEMAAISLSLECRQNPRKPEAHKINALVELCAQNTLPWEEKGTRNVVKVTSIETIFDDGLTIMGETDKSGLIFSELIPVLNQVRGVSTPFFERGRFFDTPSGRKMEYTLQCKWSQR
jgi:hypothetical protein